MRDDLILAAIDDALDGSNTCFCGNELLIALHEDTLYLECPVFESPTRLPAAIALFFREATHARRVVAALPPTPAVVADRAVRPAAVRPVAVRS